MYHTTTKWSSIFRFFPEFMQICTDKQIQLPVFTGNCTGLAEFYVSPLSVWEFFQKDVPACLGQTAVSVSFSPALAVRFSSYIFLRAYNTS